MKKERNSNVELLRIIAIAFIVISHYTVHNGINNATLPLSINRFLLEIMTLGNIGTILFILISGYFLVDSNKIKLKKLLKIILQVMFYSIIIYLICVLTGYVSFSIKEFIKACLPISYGQYWFATAYVILYLFHPYINKLLNNLNKNEHFKFILTLFIIISVLGVLTTQDYYCNEIIRFVLYYSIGAFIKKYNDTIINKISIKYSMISMILIALSIIMFDIIGIKINMFANNSIYFLSIKSPLVIIFCIGLFNYFTNKKKFKNKIINLISSSMFGVYLISDNNIIRKLLWLDLFKNAKYTTSILLIPHMVISVLIVIVICIIIDYLRIKYIEKYVFKVIDPIADKIQNKIESIKFN